MGKKRKRSYYTVCCNECGWVVLDLTPKEKDDLLKEHASQHPGHYILAIMTKNKIVFTESVDSGLVFH